MSKLASLPRIENTGNNIWPSIEDPVSLIRATRYRLEAYWIPYEISRNPHQFAEKTYFGTVLQHYLFDRELRLLLLDVIERIEISFRTQWAYYISN